jgi:hypothetical protein
VAFGHYCSAKPLYYWLQQGVDKIFIRVKIRVEDEFAIPGMRVILRIKQMIKGAGESCGEQASEGKGKPETSSEASY